MSTYDGEELQCQRYGLIAPAKVFDNWKEYQKKSLHRLGKSIGYINYFQ